MPNSDRTACGPCPTGQQAKSDQSACEAAECADGQHRHADTDDNKHDDCEAAHSPLRCLTTVDEGSTGTWSADHTGEAADGHSARVSGCPDEDGDDGHTGPDSEPQTVQDPVCFGTQHGHAGGHACQAAHTAPPCSWSGTTFTTDHTGAADDGHRTFTGLSQCVSARTYCADTGSSNLLGEAVTAQNSSTSQGYLSGYGSDRRRVPYGRNLRIAGDYYTPSLTFDNVRSPAAISIPAGEWSAMSYRTDAPASGSVTAWSYDRDLGANGAWRSCGTIRWARSFSASAGSPLVNEATSSGNRVRFPVGDCPVPTVPLTITATWAITVDNAAGAAYDRTFTPNTTSRWLVACRSTKNVATVCGVLTDDQKADLAFDGTIIAGGVELVGYELAGADRADLYAGTSAARRKWVPAARPPVMNWRSEYTQPGPWQAPGRPDAAAIARIAAGKVTAGAAYDNAVWATNRADGARRYCGRVGYRLVSLTWTAGASGAARRTTATSRYDPGPPGVWRYDADTADTATRRLPVACAAVWPLGQWDTWQPQQARIGNRDNPNNTGARATAVRSLAGCTGAAFLTPEPRTSGGRVCSPGPIAITLTAVYAAGKVKDGQPQDRNFSPAHAVWVRGARYERLPSWSGTATVTAAVYTYPDCPVPGH